LNGREIRVDVWIQIMYTRCQRLPLCLHSSINWVAMQHECGDWQPKSQKSRRKPAALGI
jgi:hypothetical protein